MSQQRTPGTSPEHSVDPWQAFGYLVAGVGFYGVLGWLLDQWLGTEFLVGVGIVVGAGLGTYLTIIRATLAERANASGPAQHDRVRDSEQES